MLIMGCLVTALSNTISDTHTHTAEGDSAVVSAAVADTQYLLC